MTKGAPFDNQNRLISPKYGKRGDPISFRLRSDLHSRFKTWMEKDGRKMTEIADAMVEFFLDRHDG